ncbi:MAG: RimK family alpha-L-glutamate ligase [Gemmatimonadales bacterium]
MRSPWDYFDHQDDFRAWFDRLDRAGVLVENRTHVLRWNLDKVYLRELGVPLAPTHWVERGTAIDLAAILREEGWERAVVKPTISAGAFNTWVTSPAEAAAHQERLGPLLARSGLIVQRFMPEIQAQGEWSLLFFRKRFSHAVVKRPRSGDFRVQVEHGGSAVPMVPTPALLAQAERVIDAVKEPLLYARVDGLDVDGEFRLMELEVLEPDLFLGHSDGAPERFANAVLGR